ncbi:MAG: hypothetical protein ACKVKN_00320 [Pseudomonadales bacterium]
MSANLPWAIGFQLANRGLVSERAIAFIRVCGDGDVIHAVMSKLGSRL